jgi:hypothetical protein
VKLLIVGSGRCVWDDLEKIGFPDNPPNSIVMAVNDMIVHYPYRVDHAYSLNRSMLDKWIAARRYNTGPIIKHSPKTNKRRSGVKSSGINAVYCGLDLGYEQIIVCGVPLDNSGHYFEPEWMKSRFDRGAGHLVKFDENIKFVSGRLCHSWS